MSNLNITATRDHLQKFDFPRLFIEELGWDSHNGNLEIDLDGQRITLYAIAHKRGMMAYHLPAIAGAIPDYPTRRKIERLLTKTAYEHLIIFTYPAQALQIWQWVKREPGKPLACREHPYHKSQSGDALIQKLQAIAFSLEDEEALTLPVVTSRARRSFDVERVTKRFYDQFKREHTEFLKFITGITDSADHEWYASVMLNRLMFVYFIQKKGFLNGDTDYLRNRLATTRQEHGKDKFYSFYRYFLLRLFHEGLGGRQRTPALEKLLGKIIPFLNGGIFEKHDIEKRWPDIEIPDSAFERLFNYFDQYQWHLDERPLRADNEINPDVLGYIFEKYINQKQMGAYYTKEDITEYISKSAIIPFLFDSARPKCKVAFDNPDGPTIWDHLKNDPDRYIYKAVRHGVDKPLPPEIEAGVDTSKPNLIERRKGWNKPAPSDYALPTEIWREVAARRKRYEEVKAKLASGEVRDINDLITLNLDLRQFAQDVIENCEGPELLRAFWHSIEKVTVLDPTCGSGAFLFAALNILEPLYEVCLDRMETFLEDEAVKLDKDKLKTTKYGCPLLPHGKMEDFSRLLDHVAAHPNRRYFIFKSIILNNLYGVDIMEEAVEICKLRLFLKLAAQVEPDKAKENYGIEPLPDIDFNIRAGNTLVGFASLDEIRRSLANDLIKKLELPAIEEKAEDVDRAFQLFHKMQTEEGMDAKEFVAAKKILRDKLHVLNDQLDRYLATEYGVDSRKKEAFDKWRKSHQPFHWLVEFYGIISKGGFDVIIGNPPWVEFANIRNQYSPKGYATFECNNLWAYVVERSYILLAKNARLGLIVPMSLVCTERMLNIQKLINSTGLSWLANFESDSNPGQLFDGVKQNVTILLTKRSFERSIWTTRLFRFFQGFRDCVFPVVEYVEWKGENPLLFGFPKVSTENELHILKKLFSRDRLVSYMTRHSKNAVLVHRIAHYYIKCFNFTPYFKSERDGKKKSEDYKEYLFNPPVEKYVSAINSSTFYFYWQVFFDAFKAGRLCVESFPLGNPEDSKTQEQLGELAKYLMKSMKDNSKRLKAKYGTTGQVEYDQFHPRNSKPIIDEIDCVLAQHYGFTEEELDFIINYDIKYRMGRDTGGDEEA